MSGHHKPRLSRSRFPAAVLAVALMLIVSGCAGSAGEEPNTAGSASAIPGAVPMLGSATQGSIVVSGLSILRTGEKLTITARIQNGGSTADELTSISTQVTSTLTLQPALSIPAGGTASLGSGGTPAVLSVNARLPTGATVALTLNFRQAGSVEIYSSFS